MALHRKWLFDVDASHQLHTHIPNTHLQHTYPNTLHAITHWPSVEQGNNTCIRMYKRRRMLAQSYNAAHELFVNSWLKNNLQYLTNTNIYWVHNKNKFQKQLLLSCSITWITNHLPKRCKADAFAQGLHNSKYQTLVFTNAVWDKSNYFGKLLSWDLKIKNCAHKRTP